MARARWLRSNARCCSSARPAPARRSRLRHPRALAAGGPFRRVNCGAIAPELIDSELFGHEAGAFTGAQARRKGWFEQADGGTLFLDEVGELALAAQVRLLRVVQDGEVVRVGGERAVRVKVRIVAATHRDLPAMVEAQAFREDLYYRLSVYPIVIPPLRDRPSDIRAFAEYFAERAANRFGLRAVPISQDDAAARRVSMAGKRAGDGRGDGSRGAHRPGPRARRRRRARPEAAHAPGRHSRESGFGDRYRASRRGDATAHRSGATCTRTAASTDRMGSRGSSRVNPHTLRSRMRKLGIEWKGFRAR